VQTILQNKKKAATNSLKVISRGRRSMRLKNEEGIGYHKFEGIENDER
jgi:hypothetical protein